VVEETGKARTDQGGKMQEKETLDEKLPGLFEPDTLLPIQYFEAMRRKHLLEGEKRLILSVLEDAIECYMKCIEAATSKGQRLFRDADEWINHEDKRWVFSFDNVCDMLDINPEYMRLGLRKWKETRLELIARRRVAQAEAAEAARIAQVTGQLVAADRAEPVAAPARVNAQPVIAAKPAAAVQRKAERRMPPQRASAAKLRKARA
jgi:hypothetical protein